MGTRLQDVKKKSRGLDRLFLPPSKGRGEAGLHTGGKEKTRQCDP
jgi:hypothetical protein